MVPDVMSGNQFYGSLDGFVAGDYPDNDYGAYGALPDQVKLIADTVRPTRATVVIYNMQA